MAEGLRYRSHPPYCQISAIAVKDGKNLEARRTNVVAPLLEQRPSKGTGSVHSVAHQLGALIQNTRLCSMP